MAIDSCYIATLPLRPVFWLIKLVMKLGFGTIKLAMKLVLGTIDLAKKLVSGTIELVSRPVFGLVNIVRNISKSVSSLCRRKPVIEKKLDTKDISILECPVVEDTDKDDLADNDTTNDSDTRVPDDAVEKKEEDTNCKDESKDDQEEKSDTLVSDKEDKSDTSVSGKEDKSVTSVSGKENKSVTSVSGKENKSDTSVSGKENKSDTSVSDEAEKIIAEESKEVVSESKMSFVKSNLTFQNIFIGVVGTVLLISNAPSAANNILAAVDIISDNLPSIINASSYIPFVEKAAPVVAKIVEYTPSFGVIQSNSSIFMKMV